MWVRLTIVKLQPGKSDEARKIYYEELVPVVKELKGHIDMFVLEPVDEKDEFISYNAWESKADGDAYEASGTYVELVNKIKHLFAGPPTLKSYEVKR